MQSAPQNPMLVQAQIRHNAEEVNDYLRDLSRWETNMTRRDLQIRHKANSSKSRHKSSTRASSGDPRTPDERRTDSASSLLEAHTQRNDPEQVNMIEHRLHEGDDAKCHPDTCSLGQQHVSHSGAIKDSEASRIHPDSLDVPKQRSHGQVDGDSVEDAERAQGNYYYARGDFGQAIRCYTRCIGRNSHNVVALSNRAMAHLKLKEFSSALQDCTTALSFDPLHVKSLQRRASARYSLGMYRAALQDLQKALQIQPSKALHVEEKKVREALRACLRRVPAVSVPVKVVRGNTPLGSEKLGGSQAMAMEGVQSDGRAGAPGKDGRTKD